MKVVAVTNGKGGVAKTTTAVHLGHYAAKEGFRTLLIDSDEGDISEVFQPADDGDFLKTGEVFRGNPGNLQPRVVRERLSLIETDDELIDLHDLPMDLLAELENELEKADDAVSVAQVRAVFSSIQERLTLPFAETLASMSSQFDLCVIDTPPHLSRRSLAVLCTSDAVVTPTNISVFTMARIAKLQSTLEAIKQEYNPRLKHLGFILSKINSKSSNEMEGVRAMREAYGDLVFDQVVIDRASVSTSLALGKPVWQGARAGAQRAAAKELSGACREILERLDLKAGV
jgi:chromosome partitioning protein